MDLTDLVLLFSIFAHPTLNKAGIIFSEALSLATADNSVKQKSTIVAFPMRNSAFLETSDIVSALELSSYL